MYLALCRKSPLFLQVSYFARQQGVLQGTNPNPTMLLVLKSLGISPDITKPIVCFSIEEAVISKMKSVIRIGKKN